MGEAGLVLEGNTLTAHGELSPEGQKAFSDALQGLLETDHQQFVLDLSDVRYMSSGYVGPIAVAMVEARKKGRPVTVLATKKSAHLLHLGGLDRLAEIRIVGD